MIRVLIFNDGADTGGGSIKIKQAFDRYLEGFEVRTIRRSDNYIAYPSDLLWPGGKPLPQEVLDLWKRADIVHMTNGERIARFLPGYAGKPKVVHYRGRGNGVAMQSALRRGIPVLVSTPNLLIPGATWLPNIGDADDLSALRATHWRPRTRRHPRRPVLIHAPTIRSVKGTDLLLAAASRLPQVDLDLIENVSLDECLRRKARGDLLFDQFGLGGAYGSNAIEAWGMGMPVVNEVPSPTMAAWFEREVGYLPFAPATPENVGEVIENVIADPTDARDRGESFFWTFHDARVVTHQLADIYRATL